MEAWFGDWIGSQILQTLTRPRMQWEDDFDLASNELALGPATGQGLSGGQGSKAVRATFISDRLVEHPFYGVVKGVDDTPSTLPVCADILTCIRRNVSQIRPCCCPPRIPCQ